MGMCSRGSVDFKCVANLNSKEQFTFQPFTPSTVGKQKENCENKLKIWRAKVVQKGNFSFFFFNFTLSREKPCMFHSKGYSPKPLACTLQLDKYNKNPRNVS